LLHGTHARCETAIARLAASAEHRPLGKDTVNWALEVVAILRLLKVRAHSTTKGSFADNGARTSLRSTRAACLWALRPFRPLSHNTISWAGERIAVLVLRHIRIARNAAIGNRDLNITGAGLRAGAARLRAVPESGPLGEHAVDWASEHVAVLILSQFRIASDTTEGIRNKNVTVTGLNTSTTGLGAHTELGPL